MIWIGVLSWQSRKVWSLLMLYFRVFIQLWKLASKKWGRIIFWKLITAALSICSKVACITVNDIGLRMIITLWTSTYEKVFELFSLENRSLRGHIEAIFKYKKGSRKKKNNPSFLFSADMVTSNRLSLKKGGGKGTSGLPDIL